jgi:uncharacterized protein YciI
MAMWLIRVRPARLAMLGEGPTREEQLRVGEHFAYLQELCREGVVHLAGRTQDTGPESMGLVLLSAPDEEAARARMEADPAVRHGVFHAALFPYRVALFNPDSLIQTWQEG